jgi:hypothetical protein
MFACSSKTLLRFSNNSYYSATPTERLKTKSMSRNGRQTPLPPSGKFKTNINQLNPYTNKVKLGYNNDGYSKFKGLRLQGYK